MGKPNTTTCKTITYFITKYIKTNFENADEVGSIPKTEVDLVVRPWCCSIKISRLSFIDLRLPWKRSWKMTCACLLWVSTLCLRSSLACRPSTSPILDLVVANNCQQIGCCETNHFKSGWVTNKRKNTNQKQNLFSCFFFWMHFSLTIVSAIVQKNLLLMPLSTDGFQFWHAQKEGTHGHHDLSQFHGDNVLCCPVLLWPSRGSQKWWPVSLWSHQAPFWYPWTAQKAVRTVDHIADQVCLHVACFKELKP